VLFCLTTGILPRLFWRLPSIILDSKSSINTRYWHNVLTSIWHDEGQNGKRRIL
jgi:hypothetical protein